MGQGSEYGKEEEKEEGQGQRWEDRRGGELQSRTPVSVLSTSGLEKSFLTVTRNKPQEKTA